MAAFVPRPFGYEGEQSMADATGIVGFLDEGQANDLDAGNIGADVEFRLEPGNENVTMRVKTEDIVELRRGTESDGHVRYHVLLKPDSHVETAVKMFRNVNAIEDATLSRLTAVADVSVSFV